MNDWGGWSISLCVVLLLLVAAGLQAVTSHPPAPSSCVHFSVYPQQAVNCLPFANCSGAKCNMTNVSGYASFIVHKCQDPVTVDLSVVTGDSVFRRQFNQTETVSSDPWPHMHIKMSRNATHLHLEVIALIGDDNIIMTTLIPSVAVSLNPSVCMCQTLKNVAQIFQDFVFPYTCLHNTACNGVHCQLSHFNSVLYTIDTVVDPCTQWLRMTICNSQGHVIYQGFCWDSQQVSFKIGNISTRLDANIVHHNYSMDVEMDLVVKLSTPNAIYGVWIVHSEWIDLLPRHTIVLDQSHCTNTTYTWTSQVQTVTMATAVCPVAIKVCVVMCLVVLVVIGVLMWKHWHRRRCRQYKIHRMMQMKKRYGNS